MSTARIASACLLSLLCACGGRPTGQGPDATGANGDAVPTGVGAEASDQPPATGAPEASTEPPAGDEPTPEPDPEPPALTTAPAPPAPGVRAPVANLAPWSLGQTFEGSVGLITDDGFLVMVDATRFVTVSGDGTTETRMRANPVGYTRVSGDRSQTQPPVAGGAFLIRGEGDTIAAIDLQTLAVRWTVRIPAVQRGREVHMSSDDVFFVVTDTTLVALDPEDGRELWRREIRNNRARQRWRAAGGLLFLHDGELRAHDARTGEERWHFNGVPWDARLFDVAGERLPVLVERTQLVLLGVADGSEQARFEIAPVPAGRSLFVDGDIVYAATRAEGDEAAVEVHAWDVGRGRRRWRSPALPVDGTGFHPTIGLDHDAVLVCTTSWTARALDRRRGRPRWSAHLRGCRNPVVWRPREDAPNVVFFGLGPSGAFARVRNPPRQRRVTVSGRIQCDGRPAARARVWVGEQRVRADAQGRYRATIRASAGVPVFVHQFNVGQLTDFCASNRRWIATQRSRVTADFDLQLADTRGLI